MDYEKIAVAFQQRLGEMAARYEADLAVQKVQFDEQIAKLQAKIAELGGEVPEESETNEGHTH